MHISGHNADIVPKYRVLKINDIYKYKTFFTYVHNAYVWLGIAKHVMSCEYVLHRFKTKPKTIRPVVTIA